MFHHVFPQIPHTKNKVETKVGTIEKSSELHPDGFYKRTMDPDINNVKAVKRSKEEKKVLRKQLKASHTLLKHEGINTVSRPTKVNKYIKCTLAEKETSLAEVSTLCYDAEP